MDYGESTGSIKPNRIIRKALLTMDNFISPKDHLSTSINIQAHRLYDLVKGIDVSSLEIPYYCMYYLEKSHLNRLFFSIQTSAHLLYRAITRKGKPVQDIILMDYGAGVGTLFLLGKLIGVKKVIYNDHLEDWKNSAEAIARACSIEIDEYIVGDIESTMEFLRHKEISCDIITSRNVVEHIYKLDQFFETVYKFNPNALVFSSTTANYYNPASYIKHFIWHSKWEKEYIILRKNIIESFGISGESAEQLAKRTRGLASEDLKTTIKEFLSRQKLPAKKQIGSNTCDPTNGVWAEHLISFTEYRNQIGAEKYIISFEPGFWDTHYSKSYKNIFAKILNRFGKVSFATGFLTAPFIYIIAEPKRKISP